MQEQLKRTHNAWIQNIPCKTKTYNDYQLQTYILLIKLNVISPIDSPYHQPFHKKWANTFTWTYRLQRIFYNTTLWRYLGSIPTKLEVTQYICASFPNLPPYESITQD
jgi:hypothetical protein